MDRNETIKRIKAALKKRSGKSWSVIGGTGTSHGWLTIDAPPARRTWVSVSTGARDETGSTIYREENHPEEEFGYTGPEDREELAKLLGLKSVGHQGESVPASNDYYQEYIDRAEGKTPSVIGVQYWD